MSPKQKKLAAKAPPPNKLDEKDFAVLRAEKAKGRGMGLQDEKIKPGKVMKARMGKDVSYKNYLKGLKKATSEVKASRADFLANLYKGPKKYSSMAEMRKAKGFKPGESASEFNKRRMALEVGKKALKATTVGKIALGVGAAGVAAQQYLKSKMKKKDEPKKKMGGGMMKKYSKGGGFDSGTPGEVRDMLNSTVIKEKGKFAKIFGGRPTKRKMEKLAEMGIPKVKKIITSKKYMGGGMMKKYSKGGGLDMGGPKAKIMQYIRDKKDDGQRLTMRDKEFIKSVMPKKMGGGMMQKPMGYNTGGYKSKEDRKEAEKNIKQARSKEGLRSFLSDAPKINQPMRKERYMEGKKARHSAFKKKLGRTAAGIASSLNPVTSAASLIGKVMGKESKKRDFQKGDYGDISVKKMGGGMMQKPMGYRSGTMVKARGCKLGRTRPTKIT